MAGLQSWSEGLLSFQALCGNRLGQRSWGDVASDPNNDDAVLCGARTRGEWGLFCKTVLALRRLPVAPVKVQAEMQPQMPLPYSPHAGELVPYKARRLRMAPQSESEEVPLPQQPAVPLPQQPADAIINWTNLKARLAHMLPLPAFKHAKVAIITVVCCCPKAAVKYALGWLRGAGQGALDELGFGNRSLGNLTASALVSTGDAALGTLDLLVGSEVQADRLPMATLMVGFLGYLVGRR